MLLSKIHFLKMLNHVLISPHSFWIRFHIWNEQSLPQSKAVLYFHDYTGCYAGAVSSLKCFTSTGHAGILLLHSMGTHTSLITSSVCTLILGQESSTPVYPHYCTKQSSKSFFGIFIFLGATVPFWHDTNLLFYSLYHSLLIKEERFYCLYTDFLF